MLDLRSIGRKFKSAVECNPGQVDNTHVPLSPSSIIWYQPMGGDALWPELDQLLLKCISITNTNYIFKK